MARPRALVRYGGNGRVLCPVVADERTGHLSSDNGTLVGVLTPTGRALSKQRGAGFVARNWLENDGDGHDQYAAAERWEQGANVIHVSGKRAAANFQGCTKGQIVVSSVPF